MLNAGSAIRYAGAFESFQRLIRKLNIPVVTTWNSIDLMTDDDPLYAGRPGIFGDRPGNFAVQNSDLVLSLGSRLSIRAGWATTGKRGRVRPIRSWWILTRRS